MDINKYLGHKWLTLSYFSEFLLLDHVLDITPNKKTINTNENK